MVLRKWKVWGPAAALGGLIYGFSPYMVSQGLGHVVFTFVPLPPFIALTVVSIMRRSGSPRRLGIQLGLLVVAQYLISPEVLAEVVIFTFAALACVAISRRADLAEFGRTLLAPFGLALAVAAALLAYPVWMLLAGPHHFAGPTIGITNGFHNDLLNFGVPGPLDRVSLGMRSVGAHLNVGSDPTEGGGYIGVPLLILTGILLWLSRRSPRMQLTAVLFVGAALLSLGPHLAVDGHLTDTPLPFLLLDHLPFVDNILPSRINFEVGAFLAAMIAFGLDDLHRASAHANPLTTRRRLPIQRWGGTIFIGAILAVLVITQLPEWPYTGAPASALPANILQAIPAGDPVAITYPYDTFLNMQPMVWQVEDSFDFRLLGGYAYRSDSTGHSTSAALMKPRGLQQLLANQSGISSYGELYGPALPVGPALVADTRASLSKYDVRLVIVDRAEVGSGPVMELFYAALGPPTLSSGEFSSWVGWHGWPRVEQFLPHIVPRLLRPVNDAKLSGAITLDSAAPAWIQVTKVEFLLTDKSHHVTLVAQGSPTLWGWIAKWNTANVANGSYSLQCIGYDASGASGVSRARPDHDQELMVCRPSVPCVAATGGPRWTCRSRGDDRHKSSATPHRR